ncbi:MAG: hypothetical protein ABEL97_14595 [Salinibacter sp.]
MTPTFRSPRTFDPRYSLLGRAFRAWTGDRLRGEALFIVALTGLALALLMAHYLGWALLKPVLTENPDWQLLFWLGQLASAGLWAGLGLVGLRPAVTVACTPSGLEIEQGGRCRTVSYDALEAAEAISATTYHRHYRRYAATAVFVGALRDEVLLLRTERGPVVLGLADAEAQAALRSRIEPTEADASPPVPQP